MEIWILDTETTGLRGKPVEVGGIRINEHCLTLDQFEQRFNPGIPIEPGAQKIHGISDADIAECPTMEDYFGEQDSAIYWIGHNAAFDVRTCDPVIIPTRELCTLKLARQYIPEAPNHKLDTLREFLGLAPQKAHSALGDCLSTLELLVAHLMPRAGVDLLTLFERQSAPRMLPKMPFGQYKGRPMTMVPKDYRDWLSRQDNLDTDMKYTLNQLKDL